MHQGYFHCIHLIFSYNYSKKFSKTVKQFGRYSNLKNPVIWLTGNFWTYNLRTKFFHGNGVQQFHIIVHSLLDISSNHPILRNYQSIPFWAIFAENRALLMFSIYGSLTSCKTSQNRWETHHKKRLTRTRTRKKLTDITAWLTTYWLTWLTDSLTN